jgi:hypothetical protein
MFPSQALGSRAHPLAKKKSKKIVGSHANPQAAHLHPPPQKKEKPWRHSTKSVVQESEPGAHRHREPRAAPSLFISHGRQAVVLISCCSHQIGPGASYSFHLHRLPTAARRSAARRTQRVAVHGVAEEEQPNGSRRRRRIRQRPPEPAPHRRSPAMRVAAAPPAAEPRAEAPRSRLGCSSPKSIGCN